MPPLILSVTLQVKFTFCEDFAGNQVKEVSFQKREKGYNYKILKQKLLMACSQKTPFFPLFLVDMFWENYKEGTPDLEKDFIFQFSYFHVNLYNLLYWEFSGNRVNYLHSSDTWLLSSLLHMSVMV